MQRQYRALLYISVFLIAGTAFAAPAAGQTLATDEVDIGSSNVTITNSEGVQSYSVGALPENVTVSNVEPGVKGASTILVGGPTATAPSTYTFTLNPDNSAYTFGDTIDFTVGGESVSLEVAGPSTTTSSVDINGSTVTVDNSVNAFSFTVTNIPSDVSVDAGVGTYRESTGSILVGGAANPAPATYSFTLDPDNSVYSVGESITLTIAGSDTTLNITQTNVPDKLKKDNVDDSEYNAVSKSASGDSDIGVRDLSTAIRSWAGNDGSKRGYVNGVRVPAGSLSDMIVYWSKKGAS